MSQRLHVGPTTGDLYDCVITRPEDCTEHKIATEWLAYGGGCYFGPWKVRIEDLSLWPLVEPVIESVFKTLGRQYPEEISYFYRGAQSIGNPYRSELDAWLEANAG